MRNVNYRRRVVDDELDVLLAGVAALSIEGARAVGKTSTAKQRARTIIDLDDPAVAEVIAADPARLTSGPPPVLIDEWQRYPPAWDLVRRAVDDDRTPGRFLLTGSATPSTRSTHSGAGRIVTLRMRPMTLFERGVSTPTVSLTELLTGNRPPLSGTTTVTLEDYTTEILNGGMPGIRHLDGRIQRAELDGYLERIIDIDLPELGASVRNPAALRRWLRAYAAATSTTASHETIRDSSTPGTGDKPARPTTLAYRDALERVWLLDPVPAWTPHTNHLGRFALAPKHQLLDPAFAARLVGLHRDALLAGRGPSTIPRDGTFLGALFESLATLEVRVHAQVAEATVAHYRERNGRREVDLIVARADRRIVAVEVKLAATVSDAAVTHLRWLADRLGDDLLDAIVITTGTEAYRRRDGIGVVPLALLGP